MQAHRDLLVMHQELVSLLRTVSEQNAQMLAAISTVIEDFEGEPEMYLDGTPVRN
jgi:hypothetical protein